MLGALAYLDWRPFSYCESLWSSGELGAAPIAVLLECRDFRPPVFVLRVFVLRECWELWHTLIGALFRIARVLGTLASLVLRPLGAFL